MAAAMRERLDVVHQRGKSVQALLPRERRLVAGLAAPILECLEQRGLLAQDVAARRDEHVHVEVEPAAQDVVTQPPDVTGAGDLLLERGRAGVLVFVPEVDDAARGPDHEAEPASSLR